MAFLREQGDKHRDMSWWCLGSRAHSISQLQNKPKKKDAVIIKSIQHGFMRFGSWVDCLRERALKYVKNLTTSPMVSLPFFIPNCARSPCCHSSRSVTHLSDSYWHCCGHKCIFTHGQQTPTSYRAGRRTDLQLQNWSWASQIETKGMQTSELWGSLNLSFLNSQHSDSILISMSHCSLGRQGIIFLLFPFYRWLSWSTARFIDLLRVAQHAWMEAEPQLAWFPLPGF